VTGSVQVPASPHVRSRIASTHWLVSGAHGRQAFVALSQPCSQATGVFHEPDELQVRRWFGPVHCALAGRHSRQLPPLQPFSHGVASLHAPRSVHTRLCIALAHSVRRGLHTPPHCLSSLHTNSHGLGMLHEPDWLQV
jgi:hypothetical protein